MRPSHEYCSNFQWHVKDFIYQKKQNGHRAFCEISLRKEPSTKLEGTFKEMFQRGATDVDRK